MVLFIIIHSGIHRDKNGLCYKDSEKESRKGRFTEGHRPEVKTPHSIAPIIILIIITIDVFNDCL